MDAAMLPTGQGTGFFVSADGYLVTNYHVIRDAAYASVVTADGLDAPGRRSRGDQRESGPRAAEGQTRDR